MGAASTSVYPTEDDEGNPVRTFYALGDVLNADQHTVDHRVRLQHLPGPPDHINPGNA
jgi:hypothetical protein